MISHRIRESRRGRLLKMSKNIQRLYKEGKCRECSVVVTRMDFAKILGKFTKVKIQYESNATPKTKKNESSPNINTRLKSNENGMVMIHRNAYNPHPVKELLSSKKSKPIESLSANKIKATEPVSPKRTKTYVQPATRQVNNILRENNRLKKIPLQRDKVSHINITKTNNYEEKIIKTNSQFKQYGIIFVQPSQNNKNDCKTTISLEELLPRIDKSILPTEDWYIEYLPKSEERTDDKVYDRIAAELEDLMYNEKPEEKQEKETGVSKSEEFPSIMDILNDDTTKNETKSNDQTESVEFKSNLESSDVEAMLLGKSNKSDKELEPATPMEVDNADVSNLIEDVAQLNAMQETSINQDNIIKDLNTKIDEIENPHSPSILDEALQKGIEEHLPVPSKLEEPRSTLSDSSPKKDCESNDTKIPPEESNSTNEITKPITEIKHEVNQDKSKEEEPEKPPPKKDITHIIFKKNVNGTCHKLVTCPKNLMYSIELEGKHVELVGAPKYISSLDDLQVLLQIVNDTDLGSLYILY